MNHLKILKQTVTGLTVAVKRAVINGFTPFVHIFIIPTMTKVKKKLDTLASKLFHCKTHMPKAEKIGLDKELNREVQMGETSKKLRSILKLKKK